MRSVLVSCIGMVLPAYQDTESTTDLSLQNRFGQALDR